MKIIPTVTVIVSALIGTVPLFANAQTGVLHRHSTAAGIVAGVAAHHAAKKAGQNRTAQGKKPNFAERHPVVTGVAAGVATHHILKK